MAATRELSHVYPLGSRVNEAGRLEVGGGDARRLERLVGPGNSQRVLVRVTPGIKPSTHDFVSTGHIDSKFGLELDDARAAIDRLRSSDRLELRGIHIHIGSQIFELGSFRRAIEAIAGLGEFPVYDLGGGLGVAYTAEDEPPSIEAYVEAKVAAAHEALGRERRLLIEPGR